MVLQKYSELESIVERYNERSDVAHVEISELRVNELGTPYVNLFSTSLFTSVFLKDIQHFFNFDNYGVMFALAADKIYIRIEF